MKLRSSSLDDIYQELLYVCEQHRRCRLRRALTVIYAAGSRTALCLLRFVNRRSLAS